MGEGWIMLWEILSSGANGFSGLLLG